MILFENLIPCQKNDLKSLDNSKSFKVIKSNNHQIYDKNKFIFCKRQLLSKLLRLGSIIV